MTSLKLDWPLMHDNITNEDRTEMIRFINNTRRFTHGEQVEAFEEEWSKWLGVKYSVFVNSGASANLLTMAHLRTAFSNGGNVVVPSLTWVSDIASVIQNGFTPIFKDIDPETLGMNDFNDIPRAYFITHVLGFPSKLPKTNLNSVLVEDCCEAHGATINGKKVGTFGDVSNFSFYFAHHMTTVEGGMISTNSKGIYEVIRSLRSHGLVREFKDKDWQDSYKKKYPRCNADFIFAHMGYNVRPTEIAAVIGRNQLKRLDENIAVRRENLKLFYRNLNGNFRKLNEEGNSNYAFPLILENKNAELVSKIEALLTEENVEFRKGLSGGGNQLRQPYLKNLGFSYKSEAFPEVEHITDYSWYIGNYPTLEKWKIESLCEKLNKVSEAKK